MYMNMYVYVSHHYYMYILTITSKYTTTYYYMYYECMCKYCVHVLLRVSVSLLHTTTTKCAQHVSTTYYH